MAGMMHGTRGSARPREARNLHAFGVDEIAGLISCPGAGLFFGWVTLTEHKWATSRERRGILPVGVEERSGAKLEMVWRYEQTVGGA
jgi:hypothetical protein